MVAIFKKKTPCGWSVEFAVDLGFEFVVGKNLTPITPKKDCKTGRT